MEQQYQPETLKRLQMEQLRILKEFIRICEQYKIPYFVNAGTIIGAVRHHGMIPWDDDIDVGMLRADYERFLEVAPKELEKNGEYRLIGPDCEEKYYNLIPMMVQNKSRFITFANDGNYQTGIAMDIFPFDYVASDPAKRAKQIKRAQGWRDLYIFRKVNYMKIPIEGFFGKLKHFIGMGIHIFLWLFRVSPDWIYRRYMKVVNQYPEEREYVTMLNDILPDKFCSRVEDLYPPVPMPFEDIMVCVPKNYDELCRRVYGDYMTPPPVEKQKNHYPKLLSFGE